MRLYRQPAIPTDTVSQHLADRYENEAGKYWEAFYQRNADKFFKDRHYFDKEFPELLEGQLTVLEVGCGVGNSVFPLLGLNPQLHVYACDFSATAVQLVQNHAEYATGRVTAFVADITTDSLSLQVPEHIVDYCSMVFVLSAIAPEKMPQAIRNVATVLKPGSGRVLFRDYAEGDLAQTRLEGVDGPRFMRGNFYVRGDGTCCYYYSEDGLKALFASEGFVCETHLVHARVIENRKSGVKMHRRWVQAVFKYAPQQVPSAQRDLAKYQWEAGQQQQQQSAEALQSGQQQQEQSAEALQSGQQQQQWSGAMHSSSVAVACAGHNWQVPERLSNSNCSGSSSSSGLYFPQLAFDLDRLLQQQPLQWLGFCLVLLPPWLMLTVHKQQQQGEGQFVLLPLDAAGPPCLCASACKESGSNSSAEHEQYMQGAAAALLALVAVRLGARRVCACMPGKDGLTGDAGPYELGFNAVAQLNECDVVIERIQQRRWEAVDRRQLQLLRRELQQQQIDVVVGQAASPSAWQAADSAEVGGDSAYNSCRVTGQAANVHLQDEVCGLLSSIWSCAQGQKNKQLLLFNSKACRKARHGAAPACMQAV